MFRHPLHNDSAAEPPSKTRVEKQIPSPVILVLIASLLFVASPPAATFANNAHSPVSGCGSVYTVRQGDTLSAIAARCGVSLSSLLSGNGLSVTSTIYPNQRLVIPSGSSTTFQAPSGVTSTYSSCTSPYVVRAGDTLGSIAVRCGVTIYALKQWNGLSSNIIRIGQTLYLRVVTSSIPSAAATPYPYYTSGATAATPSAPSTSPSIVDYPGVVPTATPRIESPISPWW